MLTFKIRRSQINNLIFHHTTKKQKQTKCKTSRNQWGKKVEKQERKINEINS